MKAQIYIGERTSEILSQFIDTNKFMNVDFRIVVGKFGAYSFVPELSGADCEDTREVLYALIETIKDEMLNNFEDFMYAATAYCIFKVVTPCFVSAHNLVANFCEFRSIGNSVWWVSQYQVYRRSLHDLHAIK